MGRVDLDFLSLFSLSYTSYSSMVGGGEAGNLLVSTGEYSWDIAAKCSAIFWTHCPLVKLLSGPQGTLVGWLE